MILTVTLNPLLERRFIIDSVLPGTSHRDSRLILRAGGKGINVSRQLKYLNTNSLAYTFTGGDNGKLLSSVIAAEGINFTAFKTKSNTREAAVIVEEKQNRVTTYFAPGSSISRSESDEFKKKLEKMIQNCEIVVFSGSSPCSETDDIFPFGIELANRFDKISLLDTYGRHLETCISKQPTILHNNLQELSLSLSRPLNSEPDVLSLLDYLYSNGIKQSFLTNGGEYLYAANFDYKFRAGTVSVDVKDAVGSGDAFTAGIAYGWYNDLVFEDTLRLAAALGAANAASFETCAAEPGEAEKLKSGIEISPLGKKMKTIDVTPQ